MATAVFIRSESGDYYLYCFDETLTEDEALDRVEPICYEERDYWCDIMVETSDG